MLHYRKVWKEYVKNNDPTFTDMIHLCLLKAYWSKANKDRVLMASDILDSAFSPIRNENKLKNGRTPFGSLRIEFNFLIPSQPKFYEKKFFWLPKSEKDNYEQVFDSPEQQEDYLLFVKDVKQKVFGDSQQQTLVGTTPYTYFFIRKDLSPEQQLVQMAHSSFILGSKTKKDDIGNTNFVFLEAIDEPDLNSIEEILQEEKLEHEVFVEPDLGNQKTVIGVYPNSKSKYRKFRRFDKFEFKSLKKSA